MQVDIMFTSQNASLFNHEKKKSWWLCVQINQAALKYWSPWLPLCWRWRKSLCKVCTSPQMFQSCYCSLLVLLSLSLHVSCSLDFSPRILASLLDENYKSEPHSTSATGSGGPYCLWELIIPQNHAELDQAMSYCRLSHFVRYFFFTSLHFTYCLFVKTHLTLLVAMLWPTDVCAINLGYKSHISPYLTLTMMWQFVYWFYKYSCIVLFFFCTGTHVVFVIG